MSERQITESQIHDLLKDTSVELGSIKRELSIIKLRLEDKISIIDYIVHELGKLTTMKSEQEIRDTIEKCNIYSANYIAKSRGEDYSVGSKCPLGGSCCFECAMCEGLKWVLNETPKGNLQEQIIDDLKGSNE